MADDDWRDKCEQLESALALAQYEARRWKEKYVVERQRRRKIARDLLDLMVLADRRAAAGGAEGTPAAAATPVASRPSMARSGVDHLGNILSPTLSSFDFDDDSSDNDDLSSASSDEEDYSAAAAAAAAAAKPNALDLRDRQSMLFHANKAGDYVVVRPNRSSTTGSVLEAGRGSRSFSSRRKGGIMYSTLPTPGSPTSATSPTSSHPQSLMYRILYAKPNVRDLWHTKSQSGRFHNVARSIMFSMHLKKEHVFEHFFVAGVADADFARIRMKGIADSGVDGADPRVCKPRVLFEYPQHPSGTPDESVADFCFPLGVPLVECTPEQATKLSGAVISRWSTDADQLQKHILEPFRTSGYTFRLTGAKGEVLYGFCAAVMKELGPAPTASSSSPSYRSPPGSPGKTVAKRASYPSRKRDSDTPTSESPRGRKHSRNPIESNSSINGTLMAPVCFCFTSKFPFYRLHFSLLRMIVENELNEGRFGVLTDNMKSTSPSNGPRTPADDDQYEVILRSKIDLGVTFSIFHQENHQQEKGNGPSATPNFTSGLGSVASMLHVSPVDKRALLSEDAPIGSSSGSRREINNADHISSHVSLQPHMRRSHSTDDISSYNVANAWIVDKPMVKFCPEKLANEYQSIQVGDVLEAIDGLSTASMSFEEALELVERGDRPMRLRFRHPTLSAATHKPNGVLPSSSSRNPHIAATSVDILHCARRLKINDPGHWSSTRFPNFHINYQLPKRHSERWTCGVVLRFLAPESFVKIIAHLLLEKQVVIMGDSPAKVTAVCAALLLFIAPFQWQSTYIPLLPSGLLDFLHSPVPFLAGCHVIESTEEWPDVCFYDIDDDRVFAPATSRRLNQTSIPNGVQLCKLLQTAKERFAALRTTGKPWYEVSDEEDKIITLTLQESEIFLRDLGFDISSQDLAASISGAVVILCALLICLFDQLFVCWMAEGQSFYDRLQEEVAKEVRKSAYEDYLEEFSQTQLFCQYYESLLQPQPNDRKI